MSPLHLSRPPMRLAPLLLLCVIAAPLAAPLAAQTRVPDAAAASRVAHATASYAGRWQLDVAASRSLPPFYAALREHRLHITQDDTLLTVDVVLVDTSGAVQNLRFPYDLRRPVHTTTQVRTPNGPLDIPTTLTATPRSDGGLEIEIAREVTMGGRVLRPGDHESWRLAPDGAELRIDRVAEMPGPDGMRTIRSHYVFRRQA